MIFVVNSFSAAVIFTFPFAVSVAVVPGSIRESAFTEPLETGVTAQYKVPALFAENTPVAEVAAILVTFG